MTPSRRWALAAAAFYAILSGLMLSPALLSAQPVFVGDDQSDLWKHVWGHWWVGESLREHLSWPLFTDLQDFPRGGRLFVIDPFNCVMDTLLGTGGFLSTSSRFNLTVWLQWTLAGWGAWRLACHVTGDPASSLVAGTVYAFCPWLVAYGVGSGVSETLGLGWIPLVATFVLRAVDGTHRDAAFAGGALVLTAWNSWYYLVFSLVLALLLLGACFTWGRPGSWLAAPTPRVWQRAFLATVVAIIGIGPLAAAFIYTLDADSSLVPAMPQRVQFIGDGTRESRYFPISDFLIPGKDRARISDVVDRLTETPYLGWTAFALTIIAWRRRRACPGMDPIVLWTALGGFFFVVSLGPAVSIVHGYRSGEVNTVFHLAHSALALGVLTSPFRVHLLTALCLGITAALGVRALQAGQRVLLGPLVAAVVLAEVCWLSPAPFPLPLSVATPPPIYEGLRLGTHEGVLDLPTLRSGTHLWPGEYYFGQTIHGGGIPCTPGGIFSPQMRDNPFFAAMWTISAGRGDPDPTLDIGRGLDELARDGYRVVVVHGEQMSRPAFRATMRQLTYWLGRPEVHLGSDVRFRLHPVTTAP